MSIKLGILVFCSVVVAAVATEGGSPHAEELKLLLNSARLNTRFSDNILEDASLAVHELQRKYGYPLEVHQVTTHDGYILTLHRIPYGLDQNNDPNVKRPVAFVMHGLLSSSADFVLMGPGCALAYLLAEAGYDVWMGNARGNFYSRKHTHLRPDATLNVNYWDFSWEGILNIDLPTMIDYALVHTGQSRLHYIGHSQGTPSFFVMCSLRPDYNRKIISMHAYAPVAYLAHSGSFY